MNLKWIVIILLVLGGGYFGYEKWVESHMLHYSCEDLDFKLGIINYDAIINGEHLNSEDWRLLPDPGGINAISDGVLRHKWLGTNHHYENYPNSRKLTLDGRECVLLPR